MKPYYSKGGIEIYHGDCREVLRAMSANADAIVTDPPYNVGFKYGADTDDSQDDDAYFDWLKSRFIACRTALKPGGALLWFWQWIRVAKGHVPRVLPVAFDIHFCGSWYQREFAGDRFTGEMPALCGGPIIWAVNEGDAKYHGPRGGHAGRATLVANHVRHDEGTGAHPCPRAYSLVRDAVRWVTPTGGLVIDPFCGSGTTLRAAKDLQMRAVGIEIDEKFCEIAARRCDQEVLPFGGRSGMTRPTPHRPRRQEQ